MVISCITQWDKLFIKKCTFMHSTGNERDIGEVLVRSLQETKYPINEKLENSMINLFAQSSEALAEAQGTNMDVEQDGIIETVNYNEMDSDGGSESSDQDEADAMTGSGLPDQAEDDAAGDKSTNKDHLEEHIEFHNGRRRRRAIFGNDADQSDLMVSISYRVCCVMRAIMYPFMLTEIKLACIVPIAF